MSQKFEKCDICDIVLAAQIGSQCDMGGASLDGIFWGEGGRVDCAGLGFHLCCLPRDFGQKTRAGVTLGVPGAGAGAGSPLRILRQIIEQVFGSCQGVGSNGALYQFA